MRVLAQTNESQAWLGKVSTVSTGLALPAFCQLPTQTSSSWRTSHDDQDSNISEAILDLKDNLLDNWNEWLTFC